MGWFGRSEHDEEQLSAYLDGELNARQAENVEQHLAVCETCSALLEELRETRALLSALPSQTPRRSFVLGAEYARAPVQEAARPSKRFNLALAPAVALSVFVALLVVDLGNFESTSSDESADMFNAATSRQVAEDDASAGAAAGSIGLSEAANSADGGTGATAGQAEDAREPATAPGSDAAGSGPAAEATPEGPPAALSAEALPTPAEAAGDIKAEADAADEPVEEPILLEAPESEEDDGVSTLRLLQVLAGAAFLASGFYVFVWPRLSRGGS